MDGPCNNEKLYNEEKFANTRTKQVENRKNNEPGKYLKLSFMLRCQGGETDVELSGELFRNLSVNFLKSRETGNAPGRKEGIELSCATNRSSNRNALENLPKTLKKSPEKETGKTELTRGLVSLPRKHLLFLYIQCA